MSSTLYYHRIYCLHGTTGDISADVTAADTVFTVEYEVLQDVTIAVGNQIQLTDGVNTSPILTITDVDAGATTLTVDQAVGFDFAAAAPTHVNRVPHWAYLWSETPDELTKCPEQADHPVQAGSWSIKDERPPYETTAIIKQSQANLSHPEIRGAVVTAAPGATTTVDMSWDYTITVQSMDGYFVAGNEGDEIDFLVAPDTPIGVLAAPASVGATTFSVSDTVLANCRPSNLCRLTASGGGTTNDLGRIIAVDHDALTITVSAAATDAFSAGDEVAVTTAPTLNLPLPSFQTKMSVGGDQIEGTDIFPGTVMRVVYRNAGPNPSRMVAYAKFLT